MDRRTFLQAGATLLGTALTTRLYAAPGTDAKMLFVFLRGAYDAANTLVPISSDLYYESRPTIAIPRPGQGKGKEAGAYELSADWGLHPSVAGGLEPLLKRKQALFVPFVGIPGVSRSHFEAQEWLELGAADIEGGVRLPTEGMLYRLANAVGGVEAVAFTDSLPSTFKGGNDIANIGLDRRPNLGQNKALREQLVASYKGHSLEAALREGLELQREVTEVFDEEQLEADRGANSAKGFEQEIGRVAALMREKFNLAFIDVGGWDTHVSQGGATGTLANRLHSLSAGLSTYAKNMGPDWNRTVVVVVSEFGRTMRENGGKGTDHGYGTAYWLLGGAVPGNKQLAGEQVLLKKSSDLNEDRDLPVLNDYRAVLGGVFRDVYGLSDEKAQAIFGEHGPRPASLIKPLA